MSNSAVLCPDCARVLGYRRQTGTISVRSSLLMEDGALWLLCGACGGRKRVDGMAAVLVPIM